LHALLGQGGRPKLHDALEAIDAATAKKTRQSVKHWPAYLRKLLTKFEESLAWRDREKRAQARVAKAAAETAPSDGAASDSTKPSCDGSSQGDEDAAWMAVFDNNLSEDDQWFAMESTDPMLAKQATPSPAAEVSVTNQQEDVTDPVQSRPGSLLEPPTRPPAHAAPADDMLAQVQQPPKIPAQEAPRQDMPMQAPLLQPPVKPSLLDMLFQGPATKSSSQSMLLQGHLLQSVQIPRHCTLSLDKLTQGPLLQPPTTPPRHVALCQPALMQGPPQQPPTMPPKALAATQTPLVSPMVTPVMQTPPVRPPKVPPMAPLTPPPTHAASLASSELRQFPPKPPVEPPQGAPECNDLCGQPPSHSPAVETPEHPIGTTMGLSGQAF
jgi:hypothetical protein